MVPNHNVYTANLNLTYADSLFDICWDQTTIYIKVKETLCWTKSLKFHVGPKPSQQINIVLRKKDMSEKNIKLISQLTEGPCVLG